MVTPERLDLARGLHDGIAQDLVGLGYSLDLLLADDTLSLNTRLSLRSARLHIDELIHKVRTEIYHLRLEPQLSLSAELNQLVNSEYSDFELDLELEDVKPSVEITSEVITIIREALRNIRTHARATRIGITLYPINNRICLQIRDNGKGGASMKNGRWGITGLQERVAALGGSITFENNFQNNSGVRITILI